MRIFTLAVIGFLIITLCSFPVLAGGGGAGGSGGSGSSVPFLHPLFNMAIFIVIGLVSLKKKN